MRIQYSIICTISLSKSKIRNGEVKTREYCTHIVFSCFAHFLDLDQRTLTKDFMLLKELITAHEESYRSKFERANHVVHNYMPLTFLPVNQDELGRHFRYLSLSKGTNKPLLQVLIRREKLSKANFVIYIIEYKWFEHQIHSIKSKS